jgi:putative transposase
MDEKVRFVVEQEQGYHSMAELCQRYGISRETGYFWLRRGIAKVASRGAEYSRGPRRHPNQTPEDLGRMILELRYVHGRWGPRKLKRFLEDHEPGRNWPAAIGIGSVAP